MLLKVCHLEVGVQCPSPVTCHLQLLLFFVEDVKRLNEKLKESNTTKGELQLKLDELQASDVSVKASEQSTVPALS